MENHYSAETGECLKSWFSSMAANGAYMDDGEPISRNQEFRQPDSTLAPFARTRDRERTQAFSIMVITLAG